MTRFQTFRLAVASLAVGATLFAGGFAGRDRGPLLGSALACGAAVVLAAWDLLARRRYAVGTAKPSRTRSTETIRPSR